MKRDDGVIRGFEKHEHSGSQAAGSIKGQTSHDLDRDLSGVNAKVS